MRIKPNKKIESNPVKNGNLNQFGNIELNQSGNSAHRKTDNLKKWFFRPWMMSFYFVMVLFPVALNLCSKAQGFYPISRLSAITYHWCKVARFWPLSIFFRSTRNFNSALSEPVLKIFYIERYHLAVDLLCLILDINLDLVLIFFRFISNHWVGLGINCRRCLMVIEVLENL